MTITLLTHQQRSMNDEDGRIHVTVPIRMVRKGRTIIKVMENAPMIFEQPLIKNNIIKALTTAFRWKAMIDSGAVSSMRDIAAKENIGMSYVGRMLRLTLLAPDIIEAILNGRQPKTLDLIDMLTFLPLEWSEQRLKLGFPEIPTTNRK